MPARRYMVAEIGDIWLAGNLLQQTEVLGTIIVSMLGIFGFIQ
jgi:hypothetical protein